MNQQALDRMRAMRATHSDAYIGAIQTPQINRQRVHKLLGPRPLAPSRKPAKPAPATAEFFSVTLRAWRASRGLSQAQAGRLLRVGRLTLASWEQGRVRCSLADSILLLMDLLP